MHSMPKPWNMDQYSTDTIIPVSVTTSILLADPDDYTDTTRQLNFSGNGIQSVDIPITDDFLVESTESFSVSLAVESQPQGVVLLQPNSEATVTILDRDGKN